MTAASAYPIELVHGVTLAGGARIRIRPIRRDDEPRLADLFGRLSFASRYQRFFTVMKRLPYDWLRHFADVDYRERLALVAEPMTPHDPGLVAVARYEPTGEDDMREIAIVVEDRWHGQGLGTILLNDLLRAAAVRGVRRFRAFVLADNRRMLGILQRAGEIVHAETEQGVTEIVFTAAA